MRKILLAAMMGLASLCPRCSGQPWHTISEAAPLAAGPDTISVMIVGDVMMHSRQLEYDFHSFLSDIAPSMKAADLTLANMEFPLAGKPYSGYPVFSTPDEYAYYAAEDCGVDVMMLANNHVLDKGVSGFRRTLRTYSAMRDSMKVFYTGAAADSADYRRTTPLMLAVGGVRLAFINFSYGSNMRSSEPWPKLNYMNKSEIEEAINSARNRGADYIIALPHWGIEYNLTHSASQKEWAEWLAEKGCDAVVGSHPHVVQDTTHIAGVPIIYSMGNLISNMSATNTRAGLVVTLRFVNDKTSGEKQMLEPKLDFTWCTLPGMLTDNYRTIYIKEWANRRNDWLNPSDHDNMIETWRRVKSATGIVD